MVLLIPLVGSRDGLDVYGGLPRENVTMAAPEPPSASAAPPHLAQHH